MTIFECNFTAVIKIINADMCIFLIICRESCAYLKISHDDALWLLLCGASWRFSNLSSLSVLNDIFSLTLSKVLDDARANALAKTFRHGKFIVGLNRQ
jgi:hypothetical protein